MIIKIILDGANLARRLKQKLFFLFIYKMLCRFAVILKIYGFKIIKEFDTLKTNYQVAFYHV